MVDLRAELPTITLPCLTRRADADASAPIELTGRKTAALMPDARLNADVLTFIPSTALVGSG